MWQGHSHGGGSTRNERRVAFGACLTGAFMLAEVAGGLISGSLALIADAAHMLTDSIALMFAWAAFRIARRPATWRHSRSEEHTSELQSLMRISYAVFCLKQTITIQITKSVHRRR